MIINRENLTDEPTRVQQALTEGTELISKVEEAKDDIHGLKNRVEEWYQEHPQLEQDFEDALALARRCGALAFRLGVQVALLENEIVDDNSTGKVIVAIRLLSYLQEEREELKAIWHDFSELRSSVFHKTDDESLKEA